MNTFVVSMFAMMLAVSSLAFCVGITALPSVLYDREGECFLITYKGFEHSRKAHRVGVRRTNKAFNEEKDGLLSESWMRDSKKLFTQEDWDKRKKPYYLLLKDKRTAFLQLGPTKKQFKGKRATSRS